MFDAGKRSGGGFSLVEIMIAMGLLVIVMAMVMTGLLYGMSSQNRSTVQNELDVDVQAAMERLKYDIRLTSQDQMYFHPPGPGPYTAISFPIVGDTNSDGLVDLDPGTGKIAWYRQVIYHVWFSEPTQLRRTLFTQRQSLTAVQRQEQLASVVTNGNGASTYEGGTSAVTEVVFQNLFNWSLYPRLSRFDGYASALSREVGTPLGSCIVTTGMNTFRFTVIGTNSYATGFKVGIDSLFVSPSYGAREGEAQLGGATWSGATPVAQYIAGGAWDGNYHLYFPATATGQYVTLSVENDRWEETNFRAAGEDHRDTTVLFDTGLSPMDYVVCLDGMRTNWLAASQADDTNGTDMLSEEFRGCAVRVSIKGWDMMGGGWIDCSGGRCRVGFRAGTDGTGLTIRRATIAECASSVSNCMDAVGTMCTLQFSGASTVDVPAGEQRWTDYASFPINKSKNYLVSYVVSPAVGKGSVRQWGDPAVTGIVHAYVIPQTASPPPADADAFALVWSSRSDVLETNVIPAVEAMFVTYATNGVYTSASFDTHMSAPAYSTMTWSNVVPAGATMTMKIRTATNENMSDNTNWTTVASPGAISPGNRQYVQFQATLGPDATTSNTPKLRSLTIRWPGESRVIDISGNFTKGPDYGVVEVAQSGGQGILAGVLVNLEVFEDLRAFGSTQRVTSALSAEIRPRNTGW